MALYRERYCLLTKNRLIEFIFKVECPIKVDNHESRFIICTMTVKTRKKIHNPVRYFISEGSSMPLVYMGIGNLPDIENLVFNSRIDLETALHIIGRDTSTNKIYKALESALKEKLD